MSNIIFYPYIPITFLYIVIFVSLLITFINYKLKANSTFLKFLFMLIIILSLANHTTFDKGIKSSELYFDKVMKLLDENGTILIESHHPKYEKEEDFRKMVDNIVERFKLNIISHDKLLTGSYYDDNRYFYFLKKQI